MIMIIKTCYEMLLALPLANVWLVMVLYQPGALQLHCRDPLAFAPRCAPSKVILDFTICSKTFPASSFVYVAIGFELSLIKFDIT